MKTGATHISPGFRPRIGVRGMLSIAGMTNSVAGTIHPGSESGTCFRTNRSSRLAPAHQCMKIKVLTGGGVCGSFATHTPPLDSRFRGNDELGGDSTGATHFRTNYRCLLPLNVIGAGRTGIGFRSCIWAHAFACIEITAGLTRDT